MGKLIVVAEKEQTDHMSCQILAIGFIPLKSYAITFIIIFTP